MNILNKHIEWLTNQPNCKSIPLFAVECYALIAFALFTGYEFVKWIIS